MLLSDMGADVVKIERPQRGDPARQMTARVGDDSAFFISVNRGKKSITLDIFVEEGRTLFTQLVPHFDVLVENFTPGTLSEIQLDYDSLKHANPPLIYPSISGFGQTGPYAHKPALDIIIQAMSGLMSLTGEVDGAPIRPGASLGDSIPGIFTALAIVSALYGRSQTGQGQHIDMSMLDCLVTMMENGFSRYFATGQVPTAIGSRHPGAAPFQSFKASDAYFVVAILTNDEDVWSRFCLTIEQSGLALDGRFRDNRGRTEHADELAKILQTTFSKKSRSHWLTALTEIGIPCGPVNSIEDVAKDPQVLHREMLTPIPHRTAGTWLVANTPFRFNSQPNGALESSPDLGQDSDDLLMSLLELPLSEIKRLRQQRVI